MSNFKRNIAHLPKEENERERERKCKKMESFKNEDH
jgi:hypothetical protein